MSTIRAYLKDSIESDQDFKTTRGLNDKMNEQTSLFGVRVFFDCGRYFIQIPDVAPLVPDILEPFVEEVSLVDNIPVEPRREAGIYWLPSAETEGVLELNSGKTASVVQLVIIGKTLEPVLELYRSIRAGTIRPQVSYEAPQMGKSVAELQKELEETTREHADLHVHVFELQAEVRRLLRNVEAVRQRNEGFIRFAGKLASAAWPFCLRRSLVKEMEEILASSTG